jgi:hypothetical protein
MSDASRNWLITILAILAVLCIGGAVAASAFRDRFAAFLAVAATALVVAALAVVRLRGGRS